MCLQQADHCDCPFCMAHAGMRITEFMFGHMQEKILNEGESSEKAMLKRVTAMNAALKKHKVPYTIKAVPGKDGDKTYYEANCNGRAAKKLAEKASFYNADNQLEGWLHEVLP